MKTEIAGVFAFVGLVCFGQQLDLSSLDRLASKAKEARVITLDPDKLALASSFVDDKSAKEALTGLKSISVRSFEFAEKGGYSKSDLDRVRKQMMAPGWSKVLAVKENEDDVEIWFYKSAAAGALVVISAEAKELTVVNIAGPADMAALGKLASLAGAADIQKMLGGGGGGAKGRGKDAPAPKNDKD